MRSKVISNDVSHRNEFKERTLKRVLEALNLVERPKERKPSAIRNVALKGLEPKRKKEGN